MERSTRRRLWLAVLLALVSALLLAAPPLAAGEIQGQSQPPLVVQPGTVHVVQRWETLALIAARYEVTADAIAQANGLTHPAVLYAGQRLLIPSPLEMPPTPGPPVCPDGCALITIATPGRGSVVTSPVLVSGQSLRSQQNLILRVLDATGYEIGRSDAKVAGSLGAIGSYSAVVTYTVPANTQPGRIQVYSQNPGDGAVEQLASVTVTLQGSGLDEAVEQLKEALESKDYTTLAGLMTDPWHLALWHTDSLSLSRAQALWQLRSRYLGPGQVFVDLSVDARRLLAGPINLAPDVNHLVYSTGWGQSRADDALLLFGVDAAGRARWGGMIYISAAQRPYAAPGRVNP